MLSASLLASARLPVWAALVMLVAAKVALLLTLGPIWTPDSDGYVQLAEQMATTGGAPASLYRILGYPAFLAACRWVAEDGWPWLAVGAQMALSLAATVAVWRLARAFGLGVGLALVAAFGHATSLALPLDQAILSDSLHASLYTLVMCGLAARLVAGRPLAPLGALSLGLLLAAAFLLREVTIVVAVGLVPLAAAASIKGRPAWRGLVVLSLAAAPLVVAQQGYKAWNRERLGVDVVTTVGQAAMVQALTIPARHDPSFFDKDTTLDRTARAIFRDYSFAEIVALNRALAGQGLADSQQAADAHARYFQAWRERPLQMLRIPLEHLRANQAQLSFRPVESLREILLWSGAGDGGLGRWNAVRNGHWWQLPLVLLDLAGKAASIAVFAAFALATPWLAWRWRVWTGPALGLWSAYGAVVGAYAVVHLETRYVAPVQGAAVVAGLAALSALMRRWRRHDAIGRQDGSGPLE